MLPALSERHDLPQHPGPLMPLGEEGQVGERIDLLLDLDLYITIARTCVGNRCCIICITCITCVRIAGAAWRLQAYARQFGQVEGRTEVYPVVSLFQGVGEKPFGLLPVKLHR